MYKQFLSRSGNTFSSYTAFSASIDGIYRINLHQLGGFKYANREETEKSDLNPFLFSRILD